MAVPKVEGAMAMDALSLHSSRGSSRKASSITGLESLLRIIMCFGTLGLRLGKRKANNALVEFDATADNVFANAQQHTRKHKTPHRTEPN